jgi:hypothetical protein
VSSLSAKSLADLMAKETWMGAARRSPTASSPRSCRGLKAAAALDRRVMNSLNVPEPFRARLEALLEPAHAMRRRRGRRHADLPRRPAAWTSRKGWSPRRPRSRRHGAHRKAKTDKAKPARATDITALCANAKLPELATGYIASNMSLDDVRTHLLVIDARMHGAEIDTKLRPTQKRRPRRPRRRRTRSTRRTFTPNATTEEEGVTSVTSPRHRFTLIPACFALMLGWLTMPALAVVKVTRACMGIEHEQFWRRTACSILAALALLRTRASSILSRLHVRFVACARTRCSNRSPRRSPSWCSCCMRTSRWPRRSCSAR